MNHFQKTRALGESFKARKAVIWHLASMALSTIIVFIVSTTLIIEVIYWLDIMILIELVFFYKSIWTLFLDEKTPIRTYGSIAVLESNFGILFWFILIIVAFFAHARTLGTWLRITRLVLWFLWLPYMVCSAINVRRALAVYARERELRMIEKRIKESEEIIEKHRDFLLQRNNLEGRVNKIISFDPSNFGVKATMFRKYAQTMADDQIRARIIEIDGEMQKLLRLKEQAELKLDALENEREALEHKLRNIINRLHILEATDPANIKIKMQKLQSEWENIKQQELQKIKPAGELETLFKKQLLLGFQIKEKSGLIENQRTEVAHLKLTEDTLQLEKHVLKLEIMDRKIKDEEPRIFELKDELKNLQIKSDEIKQFLQQQSGR